MALSPALIDKICQQAILLADLSNAELGEFCELANAAYRDGNPIISDADYDFIYLPALVERNPTHPLLQQIEPEGQGFSEEKLLLPEAMLSIDKAYSKEAVHKWIERLEKSAAEIDLAASAIQIKATPKLDGFAGFDDGSRLYTRGDSKKGSDISRVFERGLQIYNDTQRGQGAGEIVIKKSYFAKHLADNFDYPRNFQASLIKEKALDKYAKRAIEEGAALFVPFVQLPTWKGDTKILMADFEQIVEKMLNIVDFDVDGVVFEAVNANLKEKIGANRKFHRWQIAFKENKDKASVKVLSVTPQVGRTGKITPVAELEATLLSGAKIVRATGHNYGLAKSEGLGAGSVIELTRSGLVIPKINKVLTPVAVDIPKTCPSCDSSLVWESDFLMCKNHQRCPAQLTGKMEYFFKTLNNNDGFGLATIEKLYAHGVEKISQIYTLTKADLLAMGFANKTSENLLNQRHRSRVEAVEDWRFLAAFGVTRMGLGNCENLLKFYPLDEIFALDTEKISAIDGFAELSAQAIVAGLQSIEAEFNVVRATGFNLTAAVLTTDLPFFSHVLTDKKIVFSGKMNAPRATMQKRAKALGVKVVSSVGKSTDYLVVGADVGSKKLETAKKFGVTVLSEQEYLAKTSNLGANEK